MAQVEGAEATVLSTMDWTVPVGVLLLERENGVNGVQRLRPLLEARGFTYVRRMGSKMRNDLYVGAELLPAVAAVVAREQREPGGAWRESEKAGR